MGRLAKSKIDEIKELYRQGYTKKEIAEKVGVTRTTVTKYSTEKLIGEGGREEAKDFVSLRLAIKLLGHHKTLVFSNSRISNFYKSAAMFVVLINGQTLNHIKLIKKLEAIMKRLSFTFIVAAAIILQADVVLVGQMR